jgi:hypothetical protein
VVLATEKEIQLFPDSTFCVRSLKCEVYNEINDEIPIIDIFGIVVRTGSDYSYHFAFNHDFQ